MKIHIYDENSSTQTYNFGYWGLYTNVIKFIFSCDSSSICSNAGNVVVDVDDVVHSILVPRALQIKNIVMHLV